jgi:hypothetical protein
MPDTGTDFKFVLNFIDGNVIQKKTRFLKQCIYIALTLTTTNRGLVVPRCGLKRSTMTFDIKKK